MLDHTRTSVKSLIYRLTGGSHDASIKIQPDHDYIIFSGNEDEAAGQFLRGKVILKLPVSQKIKGVKLHMVGHLRLSPHKSPHAAPGTSQTTNVFDYEHPPLLIQPETALGEDARLPAGQYEWPFEVFLPGNTSETARGCCRCSISYYIKASTIRGDKESHPQAFRAIRIIRTLPTSAVDVMDAADVEGTWDGKVRYAASMKHKAAALGTQIPFDLDLNIMDSRTRVVSVRCQLVEIHRLDHSNVPGYQVYAGSREVCDWDLLGESQKEADASEEGEGPRIRITDTLPLPEAANKCSPDVDVCGIQVRHALHFDVELQGPDEGNISNHRATLPIQLFVSRALPINASGSFVAGEAVRLTEMCTGVPVPPTYGEHLRDQVVGDDETSPSREPPTYSRVRGSNGHEAHVSRPHFPTQ